MAVNRIDTVFADDSLLYLAIETPNDAAQRQNDFRQTVTVGIQVADCRLTPISVRY